MTTSETGGDGRIVILCEGDTEELTIRHFVTRQWYADDLRSVSLRPVNLFGKLQHISVKARLFLDEGNVRAVFTLIDLYGMDRVSHGPSDCFETMVERVRNWLRCQVEHRRSDAFFPHVSVHETEARILAEAGALAKRLGDTSIRPDHNAESKNFQKIPSKRINELFQSRRRGDGYHKILDGRALFGALQFEPVYNSCRYFRAFYDDLKSIATK